MMRSLCRGLSPLFFSTQRLQAPRKYTDSFNRSRNIMDLYDLNVYNEGFIFVAPNATVVGDVFMGADIAIWHGTVIRGDVNRVTYSEDKADWLTTSALAIIASSIPLPPRPPVSGLNCCSRAIMSSRIIAPFTPAPSKRECTLVTTLSFSRELFCRREPSLHLTAWCRLEE